MEKDLTYKVDINHLFHSNPFYNIFIGERWDDTAAGVGVFATDFLKTNHILSQNVLYLARKHY